MADVERWRALAACPSPWFDRSAAVARYIPPGSSVLDIGAGSCPLLECLPADCSYQPMDCTGFEGMLFADFDTGEWPEIEPGRYDIATVIGVLEHLQEPMACLAQAGKWARVVLFTYATSERAGRNAGGAHRRMGEAQLHAEVSRLNRVAEMIGQWDDHGIYKL